MHHILRSDQSINYYRSLSLYLHVRIDNLIYHCWMCNCMWRINSPEFLVMFSTYQSMCSLLYNSNYAVVNIQTCAAVLYSNYFFIISHWNVCLISFGNDDQNSTQNIVYFETHELQLIFNIYAVMYLEFRV